MNDQPSASDFVQASRILRVQSPLGPDTVLPERVRIEESVNGLFRIDLTVRSKVDINPNELIGQLVDVELEIAQGEDGEDGIYRPFNGLLTDIRAGPKVTRGLRSYNLVLQPQFWLLSQRTDHRIWMDQSAIDVLEKLLQEHGLPEPDTSGVVGSVPPLHYSVQHGERDLDYVKRRLEEFGLFWWFSHEKGSHKLRVANNASGWLPPSEAAQGENRVRLAMGSTDRNYINEWSQHFAYVPGGRAGADWNFETPKVQVKADVPSLVSLPENARREVYEYPSRAITIAETEQAEKLRMQASEADHERIYGGGNVRALESGRRFTPYEQTNPDADYEEYVVTKAVHQVVDRSYETGPDELEYRNSFEAIPSRIALTPHRTTKRPRIEGTQVAIVAGPTGEEIHTDKFGRIKLYYPWDRRAKKDGSDTCWVRVSQIWGGSSWGAQVIPRVGMEAMIGYIDGDPDKPLVVGIVPNPDNMPSYELPSHKTRMVLRSNTHKGTGFNEITFEDEAGRENQFLHAQKDRTERVLNNRTKRIDANEVASIGANRTVEVGGNQKHEIGKSYNLTIGGTGLGAIAALDSAASLSGLTAGLLKQAGEVAGGGKPLDTFAMTLASSALGFLSADGLSGREGVVAGHNPRADAGSALANSGSSVGNDADNLFPLPGIMNTIVQAFQSTTVGAAQAEQVGMSKVVNVGSTYLTNVGTKFAVQCGVNLFVMEAGGGDGKSLSKEPHISLKSGETQVTINPSGVFINGAKIEAIAGGDHVIRGKLVKINT